MPGDCLNFTSPANVCNFNFLKGATMIRRLATFVIFGLCLALSVSLAQAQPNVDGKKKDREKKQVVQTKNPAATPTRATRAG